MAWKRQVIESVRVMMETDREFTVPCFKIWTGFFAYTVIVAVLAQFVAIPLLPDIHYGHGLLKSLDAPLFHEIADSLASRIENEGWQAWTLRPKEQGISGVVAAIYAITVHEPWAIIPLNAFLHASAGLVLMLIINQITSSWRHAFIAALPFVVFPSAMTWYAQLHKDGFAIFGSLLFIYGWIVIADIKKWDEWIWPVVAALSVTGGAALVWIMRPYHVHILLAMAIAVFAMQSVMALLLWKKYVWPPGKSVKAVCVMLLIIVCAALFTVGGANINNAPVASVTGEAQMETGAAKIIRDADRTLWRRTAWLPSFLEERFETIAKIRLHFITIYPGAGSNVDTDISFNSAGDVLAHVPRALQLALLAPFPNDWFKGGSSKASNYMRWVSGAEMVVVYISFLFLPFSIWHWRNKREMRVLLIFTIGVLLVYGLVFVNIGTLYRMRYGYIMILVSLGVAGACALWTKYLERKY